MTMTPPSQCELCVPTETLTDHGISWVVELAHQTTCPNHPEATNAA